MPLTNLPVRDIKLSGMTPAAQVAFDTANGMQVTGNNGKNIWIECTSTHASNPITLTFTTPGTVRGHAVADDARVIPAGPTTARRFGPFPTDLYGSTIDMQVTGTGTLTVAAYQLVAD